MLKSIPIGLILALPAVAACAQQQAALRTVELPGFDLIVATPASPDAPIYRLDESPDALLMPLVGGQLALAFEDADVMTNALAPLRHAIGAFAGRDSHGGPFAVYAVPNGVTVASSDK